MTSCVKSLVVLMIIYHLSNAKTVNCQHVTAYCPCDSSITSGESCEIKCDNSNINYQCFGDILTCRDNDDCTVYCDGYRHCYNTKITCPSGASCTVTVAVVLMFVAVVVV
eukprot:84277_1